MSDLNNELKEAKKKLRKLQYRQREEERILKQQHEKAIVLKERVQRMDQLVKDQKKSKVQKIEPREVTQEELQELMVIYALAHLRDSPTFLCYHFNKLGTSKRD